MINPEHDAGCYEVLKAYLEVLEGDGASALNAMRTVLRVVGSREFLDRYADYFAAFDGDGREIVLGAMRHLERQMAVSN